MKRITVKKGRHLSNQLTGIYFMGTGVRFEVKFTKDSRYVLGGNDQYDWNKLYGMSHGIFPLVQSYMMHYNSSRFGWRYMPDINNYQLMPYFYINGVKSLNNPVAVLEEGKQYICTIIPWYDKVAYSIIEKGTDKLIYYFESKEKVTSYNGFLAPSYFGGNMPAPKDVSYLFKRL
jgi:hypothetical protein